MALRAQVGHLVGFLGQHIYQVWYLHSGKLVPSRDVDFDEGSDPLSDSPSDPSSDLLKPNGSATPPESDDSTGANLHYDTVDE